MDHTIYNVKVTGYIKIQIMLHIFAMIFYNTTKEKKKSTEICVNDVRCSIKRSNTPFKNLRQIIDNNTLKLSGCFCAHERQQSNFYYYVSYVFSVEPIVRILAIENVVIDAVIDVDMDVCMVVRFFLSFPLLLLISSFCRCCCN